MKSKWFMDNIFRSLCNRISFPSDSFCMLGSSDLSEEKTEIIVDRISRLEERDYSCFLEHLSLISEEYLVSEDRDKFLPVLKQKIQNYRLFGDEFPTVHALESLPSAVAVFPIHREKAPSLGHLWVFRDSNNILGEDHRSKLDGLSYCMAGFSDLKVYLKQSLPGKIVGTSWLVAYYLAVRAIDNSKLRETLAADWLVTGEVNYKTLRLEKVRIDNKTSIVTDRNWLFPGENRGDLPHDWNHEGIVRHAESVEEAVDIILERGITHSGKRSWPEKVSTIYSFSSEAETTVVVSTLLSGAGRLELFTTDSLKRSITPAQNVMKCLEQNTDVQVHIHEDRISASDVYEAEKYLKKKIGFPGKSGSDGTVLIHVTTGNKLMHFAAANIARQFRNVMLVYRERGADDLDFIGISYDGLQPVTTLLEAGFPYNQNNSTASPGRESLIALLRKARIDDVVNEPVLVGNSFPFGLIKSRVTIRPMTLEDLKIEITNRGVCSFWGHNNTLSAVFEMIGFDLTPEQARPSISLDENSRPFLSGKSFSECWILAPEYVDGIRPEIGKEVEVQQISRWNINRIKW